VKGVHCNRNTRNNTGPAAVNAAGPVADAYPQGVTEAGRNRLLCDSVEIHADVELVERAVDRGDRIPAVAVVVMSRGQQVGLGVFQ
jgi:hypothetical protein